MKTVIYLGMVTLAILSMGLTCKKDHSNECASCDQKTFVQTFSSITGVVKKVQDGEAFYDGRKYYLLVDAYDYLPKLYATDQVRIVRLFPCSRAVIFSDVDTGKSVVVTGSLSFCTTANHGLLTNNLITFNIYE